MKSKNPYNAWLGLASANTWAEGITWYQEAHEFAQALAEDNGLSVAKTAGVIAALSVSVRWSVNKTDAEDLCRSYGLGEDTYDVTLHTYGRQCEKARAILDASALASAEDIADMLGRRAFKTRAFFWCILRPESTRKVCVDRHMISAAGFDSKWTSGAKGCYDTLARLVREAAEEFGIRPCEAQAIVWCTFLDVGKRAGSIDPEEIDDEPPI